MNNAADLLDMVKARLGCLYNTEAEDSRLLFLVEDGIAELDRLAGSHEVDYGSPGLARMLLVNRTLYGMNDMLDDFPNNYLSDLVTFVNEYKKPPGGDPDGTGA